MFYPIFHTSPHDVKNLLSVLIQASVLGWQENPVITTIESAAYPMDNLQFPTVTICPGKALSFSRAPWFCQFDLGSL